MFRNSFKARKAAAAIACGLALAGSGVPALAGTVRYDLNGPAGVVHAHTEDGDVTVEEIGVDFEGLGKLTGWNTRRDGSGDAYAVGDTVKGDALLYAQYEDGTMLASDLTTINGKTYYYKDGSPVTGLLNVEGSLMYFSPDDGGARVEDSWFESSGKAGHADAGGVVATGVAKVGEKTYCFDEHGGQLTGLIKSGDDVYSFSGEEADGVRAGYAVSSCFVKVDGAQCYAGEDGKLARGYVDVDGKTYWFGEDGKSSAGWHKTDGDESKLWCNTTASGEVLAYSPTAPKTDPEPDPAPKPGVDVKLGDYKVTNPDTLSKFSEQQLTSMGAALRTWLSGQGIEPGEDAEIVIAEAGSNRVTGSLSWTDADGAVKSSAFALAGDGDVWTCTSPTTGGGDSDNAGGDQPGKADNGDSSQPGKADGKDNKADGASGDGDVKGNGVEVLNDGSASGGNMPQTGASALGLGLIAAGGAAVAAAGGKLAWNRRRDGSEDEEQETE